MLHVEQLRVTYGATKVIDGVSLRIGPHESVALIGPNGAGKSTVGRAIAGLVRHEGHVKLNSSLDTIMLDNMPAWAIARRGIVYVPEVKSIYDSLSVDENLRVVNAAIKVPKQVFTDLLAEHYARLPILRNRSRQRAGTLSGGEKKLLAIARGLLLLRSLKASSHHPLFPLLILDEPSHGLAPQALDAVKDALADLNLSLLLIEQMSRFALDVCQRAYVLQHGTVVLDGPSQSIREDALLDHYLGISLNGSSALWNRS
jgi:branched-chain amino acid transport system ATP-binding protein